jgi:PTH1 family peptidyl-tRNA hydrolase
MSRGKRWWPFAKRDRDGANIEWLVVGLGNPGDRYAGTRHNVGRDVVAVLASAHGTSLRQVKHNALFDLVTIQGVRVCLATPTTYMNESGRAVAPLSRFYRVPPMATILVFDDIDLPLGQLRIRTRGGAGGHNGAGSVFKAVGTTDMPRVRIGVGRPPARWDAADHVLARFSADERPVADAAVRSAAEAVETIVRDGLTEAMNAYN